MQRDRAPFCRCWEDRRRRTTDLLSRPSLLPCPSSSHRFLRPPVRASQTHRQTITKCKENICWSSSCPGTRHSILLPPIVSQASFFFLNRNPIQSQYRDSPPQQSSLPPPSSFYAPQPADDYSQYMHQDPAIAIAERSQPSQMPSSVPPSQVSLPMSPSMHPQQHPPSPPRPLFEFISPFDALSSSSGSMRKKNGPQQPSTVSSSGNEDSSTSWTVVSDPKRHSVDNLLDTLTRGAPSSNLSSTPPQQQQQQAPPPPAAPSNYDPYLSGPDYAQLEEARVPAAMPVVPKASPPYYARPASPRSLPASKPPVVSNMGRSGPGRFNDSPASQSGASQGPPGNGRRDKESSPGPRGGRNRGGAPKSTQIVKRQSSPPYVVFLPPIFILFLIISCPVFKCRASLLMYHRGTQRFRLHRTLYALRRLHWFDRSSPLFRAPLLELLTG